MSDNSMVIRNATIVDGEVVYENNEYTDIKSGTIV